MFFHKAIASFLGIGYMGKGSGTIAAGISTITLYGLGSGFPKVPFLLPGLCLFVTILGVWSSAKLVPIWGKDPQRVVIDEVAGIMVTFLFIPVNWTLYLMGFVLFRIFDIFKPLGIQKCEKWPHGWGIMADDVLAGLYANLILQLMLSFKVL